MNPADISDSEGGMFVAADLERKLEAARARVKTAQVLARKLQAAEAQLAEYRNKSKQLAVILNKEKRDVDKLENLSLSSLFCTILATKDEKLDRERQEYLAAKLTYDTARQVQLEVEEDVRKLQEQLSLYQNAHAAYKQLLQEKEEVLKKQDNPASRQLLALAEEEAKLAARQEGAAGGCGSGPAYAPGHRPAVKQLEQRSQLGHMGYAGRWPPLHCRQAFQD